jgi:hypothetical protein
LKSRSGTLSRSPGVRLTPLQSEANSEARIGRAFGRSDLQRVLQKQRPQRGGSWGHYSSDAMGAFASGRAKPTRSRGIRSLLLPTIICRRSRTMPKVCSPLADL